MPSSAHRLCSQLCGTRAQGNVELERQQETVEEEGPDLPYFPDVKETKEWLHQAAIMLPKVSWWVGEKEGGLRRACRWESSRRAGAPLP